MLNHYRTRLTFRNYSAKLITTPTSTVCGHCFPSTFLEILYIIPICSDKLIRSEQRINQAIRESQVIGADETGIRINGAKARVQVARTETLTHLAMHTKRSKAAFDAIGILNQFKGTLVAV